MSSHLPPPNTQRIDVWLDIACLYKTRTEAQTACKAGKVEVNGEQVKPNRLLKVNDRIRITRAAGLKQIIVVLAFSEQQLSRADAKLLYDDQTPPPTPEQIEMRRLERIFWDGRKKPTTTPDRNERRVLRKLKEEPE